ncbi:hypothetical protein AcV5_010391 [Taiwanofungus camphoratus]|nr:hypothetical protein AcV5_010391 [Antrodia cinnamomea]
MNLTHVHTHLEDPTKISKVPVATIASASQSNESEHRQMEPISLKELEHIGSAKPFPSLPKSHQTTCVHRHGTGDMIPEPSGSHQSTTPVRWDVVAPAPMAADENLSEKMKLSSQACGRKGGHGDKMPEMPQAKVCTANSSNVTTPPSSAHAEAAPPLPAVVGPAARNATTGKQKVVGTTTEKAKAKRKEKELITPLEYAQRLQAKFAEAGRPSGSSYLKGKRIFYFSNDMQYASTETRGRMDFITKHGGTLIPEYDPAQVTHVVTDASKRLLLRALGLKSLDMIPNHIPTVKWSWVISGLERYRRKRAAKVQEKTKMAAAGDGTSNTTTQPEAEEEEEVKMDHELMHASFHERIDAGPPLWPNKQNQQKQKKKQLVHQANGSGGQIGSPDMNGGQGSGELSAISEFTQDGIGSRQTLSSGRFGPSISPPLFPRILHVGGQAVSTIDQIDEPLKIAGPSSLMKGTSRIGARILSAADPLAEFYEQARAERNAEALHGQPGDEGSDDETDLKRNHTHAVNHGAHKKRAFLCDTKTNGQLAQCPNQDVIDKLEELMELHKAKPSEEDRWRVFSYGKAIRALRSYPSRIKSRQEARAIRGVGDKTAQKIMEILETGNLRRIGYEKTDDVRAITLFQGIYGVGRNTAFKWFSSGCRTLEDIEARKGGIKLSSVQKIGLKYYADINSRMPRSEAADIFNLIKPIALDIDPRLFIEIMGSYRRGKADCGDIDILITRPTDDGKTHQGVLRRLLGELHRQGILTEDLCIPDNFEDLELVYRGLCRRDVNGTRRRIDFLAVPYESRGAALLYYTGDDIVSLFWQTVRLD